MEGRLTALVNPAPLSQMEQCGRITPEQVAGMLRNDWPDCSGLGGRLQAESVAGLVPEYAIKDFTFHDLRHTFNTNMRKAGVDQTVIMKLTGHKTLAMFHRYNTVDQDDARQAMDRLNTFLSEQNFSENTDHIQTGSFSAKNKG
jgi:hypothetical protein